MKNRGKKNLGGRAAEIFKDRSGGGGGGRWLRGEDESRLSSGARRGERANAGPP